MSISKTDNQQAIVQYIHEGIQRQIEREFEIRKDEMIKDLNTRKNEICAGILMDIVKTIDIQSNLDRTVVTIREIKK